MMEPITLKTPLSALSGVGEKRFGLLKKAGLELVEDLLFHFPTSYRSGKVFPLSSERCGFFSIFDLSVVSAPGVFTMAGGRRTLRFFAEDDAGGRVSILYVNQPYLKNTVKKGDRIFFGGILQEKNGSFFLFSPERFTSLPPEDKPWSHYRFPGGISSKQGEKWIRECLVPCLSQIRENLPQEVISDLSLMPRNRAVFTLHNPSSQDEIAKAKERIAFEGLFDFSVKATLFSKKQKVGSVPAFQKKDLTPFLQNLPFSLTDAQKRVFDSIESDVVGDGTVRPMNRLIQGDVGSGKTVVAALAAYLATENGKSTLVMAPTEILARQHHATFQKFFSSFDIPVHLLCGSTTKKERDRIFLDTTKDKPYILVGTHALTEEGAKCRNVALAITDEQHRFGVRHRNLLGEKGGAYHSLVMSATPIPRSLAMFLYDEGNISIIDSLPPGRQPVETLYVGEDKMERVTGFLKEKANQGQKAYVVCPLIEDEEGKSELWSAKEEFEAIQKALPEIPSALLHGKMKPAEKSAVMESFKNGDVSILVSTTVIEVGVDVPEATVMVIRSAERFGLSQLHQLRGRVGRGKEKSYCILVSSHSGKNARERLRKLCDCHDGFELAKYDLKTRGPGEFFGTRQSGFGDLDLTDALTLPLFQKAAEEARKFVENASAEELSPYEKGTRLN